VATKKTADKSEKDDVKTAGQDESQDVQTSTQESDNDVPTKAEAAGEVDVDGAADGEVAGGVPYGETGLDGDDYDFEYVDTDEYEGALGTVREVNGSREAVDVPWTYLTATDVQEDAVRTSDADDGDVRKWNAQATADDDETPVALVPVQGTPGQTFRVDELPNVDVMKAAGIDVGQFLSGLPVRPDVEGEAPRRGIPA
jgi:hypothetical protein